MKTLRQLKSELLEDEQFKKEYDKKDIKLELGLMILKARIKAGITQEQLAKRIGTKQPAIARMECGQGSCAKIETLLKIEKALDRQIIIPCLNKLE